ncbi:MAG: TonB-dependent receptor, partial [Thermaurantiacus sp.]
MRALLVVAALVAAPVAAQRAGEDVVTAAEDAFGTSLGRESFGIYSAGSVRGFSPTRAGNNRILGLAFDQQSGPTRRVVAGTTIHVGLSAVGYPFPAPTGIVDNRLRLPGDTARVTVAGGLQDNFGFFIEGETELPLRRSLGLAIAAGVFRDRFANGTGGVVPALGLVARWTPAPGIEVIPFWGRADAFDDPTGPLYRTRDGAPPRRIARRNFQGPDWARYNGPNTNTGLITRADLGADWRLEAGLFRSGVLARTSYSNLILDIDSAGEGLRV